MTMEAQIPRFDPALAALLWEIKGVQKTTKEIKSYSRKLLIFSKESKKCKFLVLSYNLGQHQVFGYARARHMAATAASA
jgi:hypothetical protein